MTKTPSASDRRSFLGLASAAAATAGMVALPRLARAQAPGQASRARSRTPPEIYIKDWGSGRPVVLAHGWPLNADSWDYHACVLVEAGYRVIAYDRRGFGRSSQPYDGYDYDTFADDLARVLEAAGVRDATLVGFSMGGGEVVRYLARHRGKRVIKAALVGAAVPYLTRTRDNPAGFEPALFEGMKDGLRKDRPKFLRGLLKDVFYDVSIAGTTPVSQEVLDWSLQMALHAGLVGTVKCVETFAATDLRGDLAAIKVPTLLLHGTADKPVPIALARDAAARIHGATLVEYPGASHGLLVTERDRVAQDLLRFLAA